MKITEISFSYKAGLPNYSSVNASATATVIEGEDIKKAWDDLRTEVVRQTTLDQSWLNEPVVPLDTEKYKQMRANMKGEIK